MTIKYFADTDTALIDLGANPAAETREISEYVYIDLYENGKLVSMTIEHAKETGMLGELIYKEMESKPA